MLFLLFELNNQRYALDVQQIAEVLPLVELTSIARAPVPICGLFTYRGAPVPAIDLKELMLGQPAIHRLSTRIVVVHYPDPRGQLRLLGLIAERATQTVRHERSAFVTSGITNRDVPYLGPVVTDARGFVQLVDLRTLLPASFTDLLFKEPADHQWGVSA